MTLSKTLLIIIESKRGIKRNVAPYESFLRSSSKEFTNANFNIYKYKSNHAIGMAEELKYFGSKHLLETSLKKDGWTEFKQENGEKVKLKICKNHRELKKFLKESIA